MTLRFLRGPALPGLIVWVFAIVSGRAQSPDAQPAFEVASIRPAVQAAAGEGGSRSQIEFAADSLTMLNIDVEEMIEWAYGLGHYRVSGPGILAGPRYDVRARSGDPVPVATLRLMLENLLATRFKVHVHREQKAIKVYELVIAKGGPKLPTDKTKMLPPAYPRESLPRVVDGSFVFSNVSMSDFALQLGELRGIDLPVVDRTGIAGVYDLTLKSTAAAMLDSDPEALFSLIREQLGLKLVAARDPMDVLVVDHAERPTPN